MLWGGPGVQAVSSGNQEVVIGQGDDDYDDDDIDDIDDDQDEDVQNDDVDDDDDDNDDSLYRCITVLSIDPHQQPCQHKQGAEGQLVPRHHTIRGL